MRGCLTGPAGKSAKREVNGFADFPAGPDSEWYHTNAVEYFVGSADNDGPLSSPLQRKRPGEFHLRQSFTFRMSGCELKDRVITWSE